MSRPRFTIAGVIAVVTFMAVGLAALRAADDSWDGGLFGLTTLTLLTAVLLAVHRRGVRRAYWLGFSLFGWTYLISSLVPPIEARLPTTKTLVAVREMMPWSEDADDYLAFTTSPNNGMNLAALPIPSAPSPAGQWDVVVYNSPVASPNAYIKRLVALPGDAAGNFVRIGHSLLAIVFALVGGTISRRLYSGPGITKRRSEMAVPGVGGRDDRGGPGKLADDHGTPPRML